MDSPKDHQYKFSRFDEQKKEMLIAQTKEFKMELSKKTFQLKRDVSESKLSDGNKSSQLNYKVKKQETRRNDINYFRKFH